MRILVVEDEAGLREGIVDLLEGDGHIVTAVGDGVAGAEAGLRTLFDLVILDLMLPRLDGIDVCRRLRAARPGLPILMLTARGSEDDKVRGLVEGADDYVTKPFSARELLARVRALGRRAPTDDSLDEIRIDDVVIDSARMTVVRGDQLVALTFREVGIVRWLYRHQDRVVSRAELLEQVFGQRGDLQTRAVDMAIAVLRRKLEVDPAAPTVIVSVKGAGYAWRARAVTRPAGSPRALYAGGLLAVLLVALLGAWFVSGWHDVRMRQREVTEALRLSVDRRAGDIARELRSELDRLIAREAGRPYFEYQNLMHDPRASAGMNVSPSPLAHGTNDRLVLGYFQLDAKGRATTPTVNEDVPELSEPEHLADNRAFRDQVARDLAHPLAPASTSAAVAKAPGSQTVRVDPNVYVQNARPNEVYGQQGQPAKLPAPPAPVTITISPLEWRTLPFAGGPALVAIRQVQTPDGALAQGFVVDRAALSAWLAAKAGDMAAELRPDDTVGAAVVPRWGLTVEPSARARAQASSDADAVARTFVLQFGGISAIAALVASLVLVVVMRAETLARERSQFAAAAAHELRTPLAGLQLHGDMLADGLGDPGKVRDYARRMSEDAARLGRVVSNMLGFSQLERGSLSVTAGMGDLGEMLHELGERAQLALGRTGATLELSVEGDLRARFDRDAVARIVGNLLDNAEKYSRHSPDRTIRLAAIDRGTVVEVSVEDRGPGVTNKTTLFRAFSRGDRGGNGPAGLGLGLALSRSLARAMNGDLTYRPREGGGAAFVLQLART